MKLGSDVSSLTTTAANAAVQQNMTLQLAARSDSLTVNETAESAEVHVETASTQLGDVVTGKAMTIALGLSSRDFFAFGDAILGTRD